MSGKFAVIRSEMPRITIRHSGLLKSVITGDSINAQFKYGQPFDYGPHAKLWYAVNEAPETKDVTNPFFKRWDIFEFLNQFKGDKCNRFIIDELTTPEELSGILNWMLEGLQRLLKNKGFTGLKSIQQRRETWLLGSSSLYKFVKECVEEDQIFEETKEYFMENYYRYCGFHNLNALDRNVVAKQLPKLFPSIRSSKPKKGDKQVACWKGIRIAHRKWEA